MDLHKLSLSKQLEGLKKGDFTSTELTSHYLNRISELDSQLNSFITVTEDQFFIERLKLIAKERVFQLNCGL